MNKDDSDWTNYQWPESPETNSPEILGMIKDAKNQVDRQWQWEH
jgi:hypothetical protein